ncbi:hypothetical protein ACHAWF_015426 [Thalassiosira exigua]
MHFPTASTPKGCGHGAPHLNKNLQEVVQTFQSALDPSCWHVKDNVGGIRGLGAMASTLRKHGSVMATERNQEAVASSLLALGSNNILNQDDETGMSAAMDFAVGIWILENGPPREILDTSEGGDKSLISFYQKRVPCDCLKERHDQLKAESKCGRCEYCHGKRELSQLKLCGGCGITHYCSVECQKAEWPTHKDHCKELETSMSIKQFDFIRKVLARAGCGKWFMERVVVQLKKNNAQAVIKEINGSNAIVEMKDGSTLTVREGEDSMVPLQEHDAVLVIRSADVGLEGEVVCIDGTDAILKDTNENFCIVGFVQVAKIA